MWEDVGVDAGGCLSLCVCVVVVVVCVCLSPSLPASAIMRPSVYVSGSVCACLRLSLSVSYVGSVCLPG